MIIKKVFILLIVLSASNAVFAQNDGSGNTGLSFLKLGVTSRAVSLGEAVAANTNDASATHYNPAALFMGSKVNVLFMHNEQVLGVRTEFLAAKVSMKNVAFGISLNNTSINDIEVREIPGESLDKFTAQNFALGLSLAYKINENLQVGLTGKFIYEKIFVDNASGFGLDLGGLYTKDKLSIGASVSNLGSMNELRTEATKLPTGIRFGASYLIDVPKFSGGLRISADGFKVLDGGKVHGNVGLEFGFKEFLNIRAGYQTGYEDKGLTTGIGLKYRAFSLDYAFVPYKYSIGSSHTFTLGTSF
jgi:hypothetical protein